MQSNLSDDIKNLLISDIFASACGIYGKLSSQTTMGPGSYDLIEESWDQLQSGLRQVGDRLHEVPPSVMPHLKLVGKIANEAIGPGYADVCIALRNPDLEESGKRGWQAVLREIKPTIAPWADDGIPEEPAGTSASPGQPPRVSINARMIDLIQRNPESKLWTARQFAGALECGESTIKETESWKTMQELRRIARAERSVSSPTS